jgi:ABC-type dipeptide/oligopeptide/nickel transport system permease component
MLVARRLCAAVPVLVGVSVIVFLMMRLLPGDVAQLILSDWGASRDQVEKLREQLGLNDPLVVQYASFVGRALRGDLGRSVHTNRPVLPEILSQFPSTIELTLAAIGFAIVLGVTLGTVAALYHRGALDNSSMVISLLGVSMPSFWLGLLLIFVFSLTLGWFPATGRGGLERLVLPAVTLGFIAAATIARLVRSSMLDVMRQEYIVVARAKGLSGLAVIWRHALRNALIPVVTIVGLQFGNLLAGAVIVETVFTRPGLGRLTITAILGKDFTMVQGTILFTATVYILVNLLVDLSYSFIDPRIRQS